MAELPLIGETSDPNTAGVLGVSHVGASFHTRHDRSQRQRRGSRGELPGMNSHRTVRGECFVYQGPIA